MFHGLIWSIGNRLATVSKRRGIGRETTRHSLWSRNRTEYWLTHNRWLRGTTQTFECKHTAYGAIIVYFRGVSIRWCARFILNTKNIVISVSAGNCGDSFGTPSNASAKLTSLIMILLKLFVCKHSVPHFSTRTDQHKHQSIQRPSTTISWK